MSTCQRYTVTIPWSYSFHSWGQSAGSISVGLHLLVNGGDPEGLFRGAIMQSGSPLSVGDITNGQASYDLIVNETGCTGSANTLDCLRGVPADTLSRAMNRVPGLISAAVCSLDHEKVREAD